MRYSKFRELQRARQSVPDEDSTAPIHREAIGLAVLANRLHKVKVILDKAHGTIDGKDKVGLAKHEIEDLQKHIAFACEIMEHEIAAIQAAGDDAEAYYKILERFKGLGEPSTLPIKNKTDDTPTDPAPSAA